MIPKPNHLGSHYAVYFKDRGIVDVYHHRPPYSTEVYKILSELITDRPRTLLDVGCGSGDIARGMVDYVDRVDAVDFSLGMIEKGKTLPAGHHPNLNWKHGPVEEVSLDPPYALITAADSLHWMAWEEVLPRFRECLTANGSLATIERSWGDPAEVMGRLTDIFVRYSVVHDYEPFDLIEELEIRGLFHKLGEQLTKPIPWSPTMDEYIESRHSQRGFPRNLMGEERASAFAAELRETMSEFLNEGRLQLETQTRIVWGEPLNPF